MLATLFFVSVFLIAFTYAGYPALIALLARLRPRGVSRSALDANTTIIMVAYNEEVRIADKIRNCLAQRYPRNLLHLLVVSDGSDDGTNAIVEGFAADGVRLLAFAERRGKAACLNDAVDASSDEILVFCDVRQTLVDNAVANLLENFADENVGAVSGELAFRSEEISDFGEGVDAYWRYEKFIRQKEAEFDSVVGVSGALYAMRRELWQPIPDSTILDDVLIPMHVVAQGRRVVFDQRAIAWDRPSAAAADEERRKVRTLAGNFQLFTHHPGLLVPWRNPLFLQTVCHKLLRLLVPLLMLAALLSNALLARESIGWRMLLLVQLAVYGLAIVATFSTRVRHNRLLRLLAAFFQLNGFVVLGLIEFLSNRDAHRWR
ncbi:MAG TPA: glycosyltransferase family 2 protein [Dokdonella sp.]|uniref:glycosyltransferase family 2 protein n=1 Tax=Dokdonella sp. TaxID=2291710 RepID=UPI002D81063F|nr:glycosyltransferase family 2 protein [Dokdonella sp.]HET9032652.1 glycosyltransferase family 2 protein [Dokdonella sp.]